MSVRPSVRSRFVQFRSNVVCIGRCAEWAKKVSCCIAGYNFVNYGPFFKNSTVRKFTEFPDDDWVRHNVPPTQYRSYGDGLNFQKDACNICHIPSKCYHLQNGKQCKGASGVLQITRSNTAIISTCIEQFTNKIHLSGNLVSFLTVDFFKTGA